MSKSVVQIFSILFLFCFTLRVYSLSNDPVTGAYNDLVIAISDTALSEDASLEEKEDMITDIQLLLQEMSDAMFEATDETVYLGQVVILVPRSWSYTGASDQPYRFESAEIRVDTPNPLLGDLPYTQQPHVCGVQGRYIHVTPAFVSRDTTVLQRTGPPGNAMIHEWAQFRWGVREEYGYPVDDRYPYFHRDQAGNWVPTGSNNSETITGTLLTTTGEECTFTETGEPNIDCRFYPGLNSSASLLHFHHLDTVLQFSTSVNNNRLSPNKQSAICGLRSSWEVISAHPDMQRRESRVAPEVVTTVGQPAAASTDALYVVLDSTSTADSALTADIFEAVKNELSIFFTDFSDSARVALFTYQGFKDAYEFIELVPLQPLSESRSNILQALSELEATVETRRAADVALLNISDVAREQGSGENGVVFFTQNSRGTDSELSSIPELQDAKLAVVGVGYVEVANAPNMFTVCTSTGGRAFILEDSLFASGIQQAIKFAGLGDDPSTKLYQVALDVIRVKSNETVEAVVYIEAALGRDTSFVLENHDTLDLGLFDPDDEEISLTSDPRCKLNLVGVQQFICSFIDAKSGEWKVSYTCVDECADEGVQTSYSVTSYIRLPEDPMWDPSWPKLDVWTSGVNGVIDLTHEELIVYVELQAQYKPLVNATVTAILEDPMIKDVKIIEKLKDDGNEPDIVANDGIYVVKLRPISANPQYISIHVTSDDQSPAFIISRGRNWGVLPVDQVSYCCGSSYDDSITAQTYRMERTLNKTLIVRVENFNGYKMAPQIIEDLSIVGIEIGEESMTVVNLKWTAPFPRDGTDRVITYELYQSLDAETILDNIDDATLVTNDHVISGELEPLLGGAVQELGVRVDVPDNFKGAVFFRIRSISDSTIKSPLSRVVFSNIASVIENNPGPSKPPGDPSVTQETWFVALMAVLGVLLVVAIVGSTWLVRRKRRNARTTTSRLTPASLKDEIIETGIRNPGVELEPGSRRASSEQTTEL